MAHAPQLGRLVAEGADGADEAAGQHLVLVGVAVEVVQAGVGDRHVVALVVDVERRLPVDVEAVVPARGQGLHLGDAARRHFAVDRGQHLGDRGALALEADEDQAVPDLVLERLQAVARLVEVAEGFRHGQAAQLAVEVVGPAVERAGDDPAAMAAGLGDDPRSPVAAEVVERADDPVAAPHDERPLVGDVERHEVARLGHLVDVADEEPVAAEDHLLLQRGQLFAVVGPGRQAAAFLEHGVGSCQGVHGRSPLAELQPRQLARTPPRSPGN